MLIILISNNILSENYARVTYIYDSKRSKEFIYFTVKGFFLYNFSKDR